jgi:hypothetical protein
MRNLDQIFKEASAAKHRVKQVKAHQLVLEGVLLAIADKLDLTPETMQAFIERRIVAKGELPDLPNEVRDQVLAVYRRQRLVNHRAGDPSPAA